MVVSSSVVTASQVLSWAADADWFLRTSSWGASVAARQLLFALIWGTLRIVVRIGGKENQEHQAQETLEYWRTPGLRRVCETTQLFANNLAEFFQWHQDGLPWVDFWYRWGGGVGFNLTIP